MCYCVTVSPMPQILVKFSCILLLVGAAATAQPVIQPGGVVNAASNVPDGLPNSGIAQGSIFLVNGSGLGDDNPTPMNLLQNTTFPLPTSQGLNGTSVQVNYAGGTVNAIMLYESATSVAAILPSTAPIGTASVTVTYNGQVSAVSTIHVVQRAFGVFSINQTGVGPGYILNVDSSGNAVLNRVTHTAAPGQAAALVGTGLGAVRGDETQATYPGDVIQALDLQIFVGGVPGIVFASNYLGRFSCCAGVDQIDFQVPQAVEGCYVPVVVLLNNVVSNMTTMSISSNGPVCTEQGIGLSLSDLQQMVSNNSARVGNITLTRSNQTLTGPNGQQESQTDSGVATFTNLSPSQFVGAQGALPSPGGCTVQLVNAAAPPPPAVGAPIDAGPALNLNGPVGSQQLSLSSDGTSYAAQFGSAFLEPGAYALDNGGGGSSDPAAGPFQATLNAPSSFRWVNESSFATVPRTIPQRVTWSGGDPNSVVVILGLSVDSTGTFASVFTCAEKIGAGSFSIPQYVLSWLPANSIATGILALSDLVQSRFSATGLDAGYFNYQVGFARNVQYMNPAVKASPK
jgi:uncharacterized protein (TIGR03437 family)